MEMLVKKEDEHRPFPCGSTYFWNAAATRDDNGDRPEPLTHQIECRWTSLQVRSPCIKNHSATCFPPYLYIFGGFNGEMNNNDMHRFNYLTREWESLATTDINGSSAQVPKSRNGHTATLVDKRIIVIGGWLGTRPFTASDVYVFDLNKLAWFEQKSTGDIPYGCNMHSANYVPHCRSIFVFRGGDGRLYLNDLYLLNVDTFRWQQPIKVIGTPPPPRANHASELIADKMYIFGGWNGKVRLNDLHIFCTRTFTWTQPEIYGVPPSPRAGMSLTAKNGYLYLFGGSGTNSESFNDIHLFDSKKSTWIEATYEPDIVSQYISARFSNSQCSHQHAATQKGVVNNNHYMNKKETNPSETKYLPAPVPTVYVTGQKPMVRSGHSATLIGRHIVIIGGGCKYAYPNHIVVLDTDVLPSIVVTQTKPPFGREDYNLRHFINNPTFSDVCFSVENKKIYGHKIVLSLASEHFRTMFKMQKGYGFAEARQQEIQLLDVSYETFQQILSFLYTGKIMTENSSSHPTKICEHGYSQEKSAPNKDQVKPSNSSSALNADSNKESSREKYEVPRAVTRLAELLLAADRYMLDNLKQLCEFQLAKIISRETIEFVLKCSRFAHAAQLHRLCQYFLRNEMRYDGE